MKMGFIGVGLMGQGMSTCLLKAGHELAVVAHSNRKPIDYLVRQGAVEIPTIRALATDCEVLFLCLPSADTVASVIQQMEPVLQVGQLIIDTSTSLPERSVGWARQLRDQGVGFVDAPVTGGPEGAAAGALASMVGGYEPDYLRAAPLIDCYSKQVVYFGESGAGNRAKLIHNFITTGQVALIVEAVRLCDQAGLDRSKLYSVLSQGGAASKTLEKLLPSALEGRYDGHRFSLEHASKDVAYIHQMMGQLHSDSQMIEGITHFFQRALMQYPKETFLSGLLKTDEKPTGK
ncbi:MAG: NAD(P)-dependent oxidoreductase [Sedimenticola sp.]|nr:NAD(P)-dependent oxidoreductase [Sedimenticola sp.]